MIRYLPLIFVFASPLAHAKTKKWADKNGEIKFCAATVYALQKKFHEKAGRYSAHTDVLGWGESECPKRFKIRMTDAAITRFEALITSKNKKSQWSINQDRTMTRIK